MPGANFSLAKSFFLPEKQALAENAYLAALEYCPGYYRALGGLAKVGAAQGRYLDAIKLYNQAIAKVPYPEYAAALGDIYRQLGQLDNAKKQYDLVEFIAYLSQVNRQIHNRDLALFYADHDLKLPESLALAQNELEVRRDIYTWDVLAWSLFKNGKFREANEAISHALEQGTKDPQLFFHAGMIYEKLGDSLKAQEFLRRALATNPNFHIAYAETARQTLDRINQCRSQASAREVANAY